MNPCYILIRDSGGDHTVSSFLDCYLMPSPYVQKGCIGYAMCLMRPCGLHTCLRIKENAESQHLVRM
jgi:hypothetical protein